MSSGGQNARLHGNKPTITVTAGNLVVGAVVFLILTMIQFIVISKGSERVAEVVARFTLDAMLGASVFRELAPRRPFARLSLRG